MRNKLHIRVLALLSAVVMLLCAAGCGKDEEVPGSDAESAGIAENVSGADFGPSGIAESTSGSDAAERAAVQTLAAYFDAFNAKDAGRIANIVFCDATAVSGMSRDDIAQIMRSGIESTVAIYGEDFHYNYDPEQFVCENADDQVDAINQSFGIQDSDVRVDAARIVRATVSMVDSDGVEHEPETGSMLVYRYDGAWYLYGYAG